MCPIVSCSIYACTCTLVPTLRFVLFVLDPSPLLSQRSPRGLGGFIPFLIHRMLRTTSPSSPLSVSISLPHGPLSTLTYSCLSSCSQVSTGKKIVYNHCNTEICSLFAIIVSFCNNCILKYNKNTTLLDSY